MSYHDRNLRAADPKPSLMDRARDWIHRNVPVHAQAEMDMLLQINRDLMLRLISKCLDFEALADAHRKLQFEVAKEMPQVPWSASGDVFTRIEDMSRNFTMSWEVKPVVQRFAVSDPKFLRNRLDSGVVRDAMRGYFDEVTAPKLFQAAEASLMRSMAQVSL